MELVGKEGNGEDSPKPRTGGTESAASVVHQAYRRRGDWRL